MPFCMFFIELKTSAMTCDFSPTAPLLFKSDVFFGCPNGRIKRQASYADSQVNPCVASHMPRMAAQIMQPNAALNNFPGNLNSLSTEEDYRYKSTKVEGQWQRDRDALNVVNQTPSHSFIEGKPRGQWTRSYYQGQMPDQKQGSDNQSNGEPRSLPREQDMAIGHEDKPSLLTFEGLEQKFLDEISNLVKEQKDAEAVENERHREKITELKTKYQEKILALHSQQAARREEFLRMESQARLNQYQQAGMNHYLNTGILDTHGTPEEFLRKESTFNSSSSSFGLFIAASTASVAATTSPSTGFSFPLSSTTSVPAITSPSSGFSFAASTSSLAASTTSSTGFPFAPSGASPSTGFPFAASTASAAAPSSAPVAIGSSIVASSGPTFSFTSAMATPTSQPVFGNPNPFTINPSSLGNNDQMNMEDGMVEDTIQASMPTVPVFDQAPVTPQSGFVFWSTPSAGNPFQFGAPQNSATPQNQSPFQTSNSLGGSFSVCAGGGGDKANQKIVRVSRNKTQRK